MVQALANWLLSLARNTTDARGRIGVLKIYSHRNDVRGYCAIALDRLIEHTGASRADVVSAIGSLMPTAGIGKRVHVVVTTPERIDADKRNARLQILENRDNQISNRLSYLIAADRIVTMNLPEFIAPADETTVN